jgi:dihydrofolate reductase
MVFNMVTLEGFFEGANPWAIDWHRVDEEFNTFAIEQLNSLDAIVFGRLTYEGMASYWPTSAAIADNPDIADKMNSTPKIVFSRTLDKVEWNNTRLIKDNIAEEIRKLKQQRGKDLIIFGSGKLTVSLLNLRLIDEIRNIVVPVILGSGRPLFEGVQGQLDLKLVKSRTFQNGNVLLCYQPNVSQ